MLVYHQDTGTALDPAFAVRASVKQGDETSNEADAELVSLMVTRLRDPQVTDSESSHTQPAEPPAGREAETTGESTGKALSPIVAKLIQAAGESIGQVENPDVAQRSRSVLTTLQEILGLYVDKGGGLDRLSTVSGFPVEDGSVLIDWPFTGFRIGFTIEPDQTESGWYLVSDSEHGGIFASGSLSTVQLEPLVGWLLFFVLLNS
jgi:hypothetical protein